MSSTEVLEYLEKQHQDFVREVRRITAAQIRYVRRLKRMTVEEFRADLEAEREAILRAGIPYWVTPGSREPVLDPAPEY